MKELLHSLFVSTLFCLLIIQSIFPCLASERYNTSSCIESERVALLTFKASISDPGNMLSSWEGEDCCRWWGVACSNKTNRVVGLNLHCTEDGHFFDSCLTGEIDSSLLGLKHLRRLDLSWNNFPGSTIPKFIGSLENLRYLNLSSAGFSGLVPPELGNLSRLHYLDLYEYFISSSKFYVNDLRWISHLSSLKYLDMSFVDLSAASDWLLMVNMLPSLEFLRLVCCGLNFIPNSLSYINFTSLNTLDLSNNHLNSILPQWFWNVSSLTVLDLHYNTFYGPIPDTIGNLISLEVLELKGNNFTGTIPMSIKNLENLNTLDLSNNQLVGPVSPAEIGKLSQLIYLNLDVNFFTGVISETHFTNLTRLKKLILSMNNLTFSVNESWVPPFQLNRIGLGTCRLGPLFPAWLQHQREVAQLDLSNNGISGTVPEWFWKKFPLLINYLDLSNNQMRGELSKSMNQFPQGSEIFLNSNQFEGPLPPNLLTSASCLDLSNNSFSGPLPSIEVPHLDILQLSNNLFNSVIPSSLCKTGSLLDLSNNNLSGEIPDEWEAKFLMFLNLANNHLSGGFPSSIGFLTSLTVLSLSNNSLSGLLPASLQLSKGLVFLDLSQNVLSGNIPTWLGENLTSLSFLSLRSNIFSGSIPLQLVQLHKLKVLDLADNNLSGTIPHSLGNLSAMASITEHYNYPDFFTLDLYTSHNILNYYIGLLVFMKGETLDYTKNRYLVKNIDLSDNYLRGKVPEGIGALIGVVNLNLSENHLEGKIPENIGRMQSLESLDLSKNEFSGSIPLSISSLNSLSYLNLSYNHLSGRIPSGDQLQTLMDPSIYVGNTDLCGPPLAKNCSSNNTNEGGNGGYDDKDGDEVVWVYYSIGLGYIAGVWTVCGVLFFKKTWRYAYFQFFDNMCDWLYVFVILTLAKLKRNRMVCT